MKNNTVRDLQHTHAQSEGQLAALMERLAEEFGVHSLAEAEEALVLLEARAQRAKVKARVLHDEFINTYKELLDEYDCEIPSF